MSPPARTRRAGQTPIAPWSGRPTSSSDSAELSDETWSELAKELDEQQLMDLVFTVGAYEALAMAFLTFGVELDADLDSHELHVPMEPRSGSNSVSMEGPSQ